MRVMIDGVEYRPGDGAKVGVAITTHNRHDVLERAIEHHLRHLPPGAPLVVVDDGSKSPARVPEVVQLFRFDTPQGIPVAKNKCLELLMDAGCDFLALWDDDAWPVADGWWEPYAQSPEHHLSYQFEDLSGSKKLRDITKIWDDGCHVAYTGQRGVMLWYRRAAIEKVGGFDEVYSPGYYEHVDLAARISEAGLSTFKYMDVAGSDQLIYSLDEHGEVTRTTRPDEHAKQVQRNANIFNTRRDNRDFPAYAEYRKPITAVLTCLLTGSDDPQRGSRMESSYRMLRALHKSIPESARMVVFHDNPVEGAPEDIHLAGVPAGGNPYFDRWVHALLYLRDHPEIRQVVVCDGTDVEFLQDPFPLLPSDAVVVGEEFQVTGCEWMRENHQWQKLTELWLTRGRHQLLNAGVLAGDRDRIISFLQDLITEYEDYRFDAFNGGRRGAGVMVGDMAIFNLVAARHAVVHGPQWTTGFKREERNGFSVFKHK